MKHALLFSFVGIGMLPLSDQFTKLATNDNPPIEQVTVNKSAAKEIDLFSQEPGNEKMLATVFKAQDFCRAELKDFEFDIHYSVVSATVYFSGGNFRGVEKGTITSNSLKPIKSIMDRCVPGTMVIFDDVKVVGPDKLVRPIAGLSLVLR